MQARTPPLRTLDVHARSRIPLLVILGACAAIGLAALAIGDARSFEGRVLRNITINGHQAGGLSGAALDSLIDDVQDDIDAMTIRVATPDGGFTTTGDALHITVDRVAVRHDLLLAGRPARLVDRVSSYLESLVVKRPVNVAVSVPLASTLAVLQLNEGAERREAVDPKLKLTNGAYRVLPGSDGQGIDATKLVAAIESAIESGQRDPVVPARRETLPSRFTTEELTALADRATQLTANPLRFTVDGKLNEIGSESLRAWMKPAIIERQVVLTLDETKTINGLRSILGEELRPVRDARLAINGAGKVEAVASQEGLRCCTPQSVRELQQAFNGLVPQPIELELEHIQPHLTTEEALALNVKEPIATFTTKHRSGEDRVTNIHRMADLTRGVVIKPGETFSVNKFVGERTEAKGFVNAHSISDGVFVDTVGGGVSQYATTLFNAAFYAGLDIPFHKPHSIYISRYPKGLDSTLAYPGVDLKIRNNSPYGVMIWPTYTDASITITLYSTPWVKATIEDTKEYKKDQCTVVETARLRTFPDGNTKKDRMRAEYLPKEGINCDGSNTPGNSSTTIALPTAPPTTTGEPTESAPQTTRGSQPPSATTATLPPVEATSQVPRPTEAPTETTRVEAATTKATRVPVTQAEPPSSEPATTAEPAPAPTPAPGPIPVNPPVTGVS